MSEYYDHYHRWEPLAEFHFTVDENGELYEDDNYVYCLCSRAFIREGVKTYYTEKEDVSESDVEVVKEPQSQECEDQSHVHFSADTCKKVKCEKDDGASCYCSASHTENYCSTDEHDPTQNHGNILHGLQPSDSGADLTYPDCQSDCTNNDKLDIIHQALPETNLEYLNSNEEYLSEDTWEKFWTINGERIIWASWIKRYSDYINPTYLEDNKDLVTDDNNLPKQHSADEIFNNENANNNRESDESMRERKFSYDSKVNPYKKNKTQSITERNEKNSELICNKDNTFTPIGRTRSCSEHDRMLSPRTLAGTDSMTNVTKITLSSYDVNSSHVTSDSSPTEDYSVSSSSSDDQNDQTRIANVNENNEAPSEEHDTDDYWQILWKKHFGEIYALHYANYIETFDAQKKDTPAINIEVIPDKRITEAGKTDEKVTEIKLENSEGNSQELPTVNEVETGVAEISLATKNAKKETKKKGSRKRSSNKYLGSVGLLLQSLLKEEQKKSIEEDNVPLGEDSVPVDRDSVPVDKHNVPVGEDSVPVDKDNVVDEDNVPVDAPDGNDNNSEPIMQDSVDAILNVSNVEQSESNSNFSQYSYNDGDDDPPEDKPVNLKRGHELDEEEVAVKIQNTFETMGFFIDPNKIPKGELIYRKHHKRLRPPRSRRFGAPRKTYFDDDGNSYSKDEENVCQVEKEMQTDDTAVKDSEKATDITNNMSMDTSRTDLDTLKRSLDSDKELTLRASKVPFPDLDASFSDAQEVTDSDLKVEDTALGTSIKRKRRAKRYKIDTQGVDISDMPQELADDPKMVKYWKKRHSLFHRFDEGIKLDKESWFSVTPENVAKHIATKYTYDVVLDAFCGAGGNTIQFAMTSERVIAIDIDPAKIEMARHNATVYGVANRIEFIVGDFFLLAPKLQADMVFMSPPWGGPKYSENSEYDIETMLEPKPASDLMEAARTISNNITLYLPRNTKTEQVIALVQDVGGSLEIEQSFLDRRFVAITAYFY